MLKEIYKLGKLTLLNTQREKEYKEHKLIDLFWECTLSCNAKCKHCGSNALNQKYEGELTTQEIKDGFKQIAEDFEPSSILINVTGGEPLIRSDLFEVMEYASKELGFYWGMTSNGMLLSDENVEKLKQSNMDTISISIDGIGKTHDDFRGTPGAYDRILDGIKRLQEKNFVNHIQVTTVFHKGNISQIEHMYEVMKKLKLDSWRIATIDPIGRANDNNNLLLDANEIRHILDFILEKKKDKSLELTYGCPSFLGLKYENAVRDYYFKCRTGVNVASILYNGDLYVCPNVPRIPELVQGNIRQDRFSDIWNNKYSQFRNKKRTECNECNECENLNFCFGGAYHTWNFEDNVQNKCIYKMLENSNN